MVSKSEARSAGRLSERQPSMFPPVLNEEIFPDLDADKPYTAWQLRYTYVGVSFACSN